MTCQEAERVTSHCCDGQVGWPERAGLRVHFYYCRGCKVAARQLALLRKAASQLRDRPRTSMPPDVADRLRERLSRGPV
jgi:hypothetical protein